MTELALVTSAESEIQPWERQEGEPLFWYNRYKRYQSLGPKRTILAALQQERLFKKAPKSTQKQEKPKPKKSVAVPGSWKAASIRWNWVARAQAFDEDKVEKIVAIHFENLYDTPALAYSRVMMLNGLLETIVKDYNAHYHLMSPEQRVAYFARMTRILADIREEMRTFDHVTQALILRHLTYKEYKDYKSPTSPEGFADLVEKAGGLDAAHKGIEKEDARRKERKALEQLARESLGIE
jgi:hypothetical protein